MPWPNRAYMSHNVTCGSVCHSYRHIRALYACSLLTTYAGGLLWVKSVVVGDIPLKFPFDFHLITRHEISCTAKISKALKLRYNLRDIVICERPDILCECPGMMRVLDVINQVLKPDISYSGGWKICQHLHINIQPKLLLYKKYKILVPKLGWC